jgi:hypothetical protein
MIVRLGFLAAPGAAPNQTNQKGKLGRRATERKPSTLRPLTRPPESSGLAIAPKMSD